MNPMLYVNETAQNVYPVLLLSVGFGIPIAWGILAGSVTAWNWIRAHSPWPKKQRSYWDVGSENDQRAAGLRRELEIYEPSSMRDAALGIVWACDAQWELFEATGAVFAHQAFTAMQKMHAAAMTIVEEEVRKAEVAEGGPDELTAARGLLERLAYDNDRTDGLLSCTGCGALAGRGHVDPCHVGAYEQRYGPLASQEAPKADS